MPKDFHNFKSSVIKAWIWDDKVIANLMGGLILTLLPWGFLYWQFSIFDKTLSSRSSPTWISAWWQWCQHPHCTNASSCVSCCVIHTRILHHNFKTYWNCLVILPMLLTEALAMFSSKSSFISLSDFGKTICYVVEQSVHFPFLLQCLKLESEFSCDPRTGMITVTWT